MDNSQLLRWTPDQFRGRVFATLQSLRWATMMLSMVAAELASQYYSAHTIGVVAGLLGVATALAWAWCDWRGYLREPQEARPAG